MKQKRNRTPIDLRTMNRDLLKAPAVVKAQHVNTGPRSRIVIGPDGASNGRWTVRRLALIQGPVISPEWLRVKDLPIINSDRTLLLQTLFGLKSGVDVRFEVALKDDKMVEELRKLDPSGLVKFKRTRARYSEDWAEYVVYRADGGAILGIDARWADLFSLNYVWRSEGGPIIDNPDPEKINVFFPATSGRLPEEASFASFAGGFIQEQTEQP